MLVKCCALKFLFKFKLFVSASIIIIIICLISLRQMYQNMQTHLFKHEPIDVVYTWVNGSDPKFLQSLEMYLNINSTTQDYSSQRFDDKYELKFSLRSLEKYAPWIRHVYIVTNGQIPYWLNLDYEKVTLISHKEIFSDSYDLPTFSSPAIESHLHRIPGLSKRFIYINDDVFIGAPIYIDDFISQTQGFLIYLTWPLPTCAIDCPWVYVGDGQCDISCYNTNCQYDGNDCAKINHPWEVINFDVAEALEGPAIVLAYYHATSQTMSVNHNQRNSVDSSKVLFNSKIGLEVEPTLANPKRLLFNADNVTKIIQQHNKKLILHNKLRRKKRSAYKNRNEYANFSEVTNLKHNTVNIDTYGASLQHTNRIYNLIYGFKSRYVPAHAPIMIDKDIVTELQNKFDKEVKKTSSNKIRSKNDIQFAFSYYYYLMNERTKLNVADIFDRFDTDQSGTWSDREIRTVLTKIFSLPLSYATVDHFENILVNCSKQKKYPVVQTPEYERYIDSKLPTISKELVVNCPILSVPLEEHFGSKPKYKFEVIYNSQTSHVTFKMLNSNISDVVEHLDEIRRHTRKFVCLNDNMDPSKVSENNLIKAVLYDFYASLFPAPSKFELPVDFRNRFFI